MNIKRKILALIIVIIFILLIISVNNKQFSQDEKNNKPNHIVINEIYRIGPMGINLTNWKYMDYKNQTEAPGYLAWIELYNPTDRI